MIQQLSRLYKDEIMFCHIWIVGEEIQLLFPDSSGAKVGTT